MGLVLPAFVSLSPFSLDCVFSFAYLASLVKLESFQGSGPQRFNLPAPLEDNINLSYPPLTTALMLPVGYLGDFDRVFSRETCY